MSYLHQGLKTFGFFGSQKKYFLIWFWYFKKTNVMILVPGNKGSGSLKNDKYSY